jgi:arsenite methyltransferase
MTGKDYFDQVASRWDTMRQSFYSEQVREKTLAVAGVKRGAVAADVGAGTGFITEALVRAGLRVIAVDQSEAMLAEMRRKFADVQGIEYHLGNGESLPIPDETCDYAFANMFLHHAEYPEQAIREMARILKPGGVLVITDLDEHGFTFLREEHHDRWLGFRREDVRRWFIQAGLKRVRVDSIEENCCASSSCGSESVTIGIFVASGEKMDEEEEALMNQVYSDEDIKQAVRERYGQIARDSRPGAGAACCGPTSCCDDGGAAMRLYADETLTELPPEVTGLALGCGDPLGVQGLQPGQTVLDLGSGGGIDCFRAAQQVGPAGHVIGVDMTPEMIDRARRNAQQLGLTNVEFRLGEIEHLPLVDASVDVIISNCVINLVPDKRQVFREAYRVLRPGGWLSVSDIVTRGELPEALRRNLAAWTGCLAGAVDVEEYIVGLREAGFEEVQVTPENPNLPIPSPVFSARITARKAYRPG